MSDCTFSLADVQRWDGHPLIRPSVRMPGYQGIWFALGFKYEYGDKYSGGLGTYTANHQPMAVHAAAVNKTFFTYGGTTGRTRRELAIMVSYYDHATHEVPRPVVLYLDPSVGDPHDNAAIQLDASGHLWVFKSGRGTGRPGLIFRSAAPYVIDAFELVDVQEFTYPQVWRLASGGFFLLFSKYVFYKDRGPARNLFWKTSPDGRAWTADRELAGFDGHYQTSGQFGGKIATFFNWHPGSDNDRRTNLYYAQSTDGGKTWTTAGGRVLDLPLRDFANEALVIDYQAQGKCLYTCDVNFDDQGNPILLYILSRKGEPGPAGGAREWTVLHWKDGTWRSHVITPSDHNYDMGSLWVHGREWRVIGPTEPAPQPYGTGGEVGEWVSRDEGETWERRKVVTSGSPFNHSYVRRPSGALDPFYAFWADGDPRQLSESHLYFTDSGGDRVRRLPYDMATEFAAPEDVTTG